MAFDIIVTKSIVNELNQKLVDGRINRIYHPEKEELILHIHTKGEKYRLLASAVSSAPRLHLMSDNNEDNPLTPSGFCMLLRKYIQGGKIIQVSQIEHERIVCIKIASSNELGVRITLDLYIEIMGKHSNIILVDSQSNTILESIKRISLSTSSVRPIFPGLHYTLPPAQNKVPFDQLSKEEFEQAIVSKRNMLATISGISKSICNEIFEHQIYDQSGFSYIQKLKNSMSTKGFLYVDIDDKPIDYHSYKLDYTMPNFIYFDSISQCIEEFYKRKIDTNRVNQRATYLTKHISSLLQKSELKLQRLNEDLLEAKDSDKLKLYGELLLANAHLTAHDSISVLNYYDNTNIVIPLDPRFSIAKNSQLYYKKYGKLQTAIKEKSKQISETQNDIIYLQSILQNLQTLTSYDDISTIYDELVEVGLIAKRKKNQQQKKIKLKPLTFTSPSGKMILVGKNNKENDYITTKLAKSNDIWLHAKDIPGSHVLIVNENNDSIDDDDILYAASIAAFYSKGRFSNNVPIDYMLAKQVKKPNGAKPGMVIFTGNKTVYVTPKDGTEIPC